MLSVSSRTSANTGVAPVCTITFAVAGQVSDVVITSSPGPDAERDEREVQCGGARRDGEDVLRLEVLAHPRLELGGARPRREPARSGASRRPPRSPLPRSPAAGTRGTQIASRRRPASAVTKRMRSAAAFARASASSRDPPCASTAPARSAPRRSGGENVARVAVDADTLDALELLGHLDALEHPGRSDQELRDRSPPPVVRVDSTTTSYPSAASIARPFTSIPVTASASSASWPPPSRAATSITCGPSEPIRSCVYEGPFSIPRAATARDTVSDTFEVSRHRWTARRARARRRRRAARPRAGR